MESPFPGYAWPRVWEWMEDFRSRVADDFGPQTMAEFVAHCLERSKAEKSWGVWSDDELCGLVTFAPQSPVAGTSHLMLRKDFWGRKIGETALRRVCAEIFAGTHTKIVTTPFRDNNAIIGLRSKLGFKREGVLRKQTMRGGQLADLVVLGLIKEDFACLSE